MHTLAYILAYPFLIFIAFLPFKLLYILSDCVYFILYKIIRYRKKTVRQNLKIAFPNLTEKEYEKIEKEFYKHFCDLFFEMIKTLHISEKELKKRFVFQNIELVKEFEQKNKSIILMLPHYANWEWSIILGKYISFKGIGVYKPLANKKFDALIQKIRAKFDAELVGIYETSMAIKRNEQNGKKGIYLFLSDQSPIYRKGLHWESFFDVKVPVHAGAEVLARKFNLNIMYLNIEKVKRGYYQARFISITDTISEEPKYAPLGKFFKLTENQIRKAPAYYFWTHNRWKHQGKEQI